MATFLFKERLESWQQAFRRSQSAGILPRIVAWLILGAVLAVGLVILITFLVLSWLLIPLLLFKRRKAVKARYGAGQAYQRQTSNIVIEGEVTEVKDERR
jgi:hypothetical protein